MNLRPLFLAGALLLVGAGCDNAANNNAPAENENTESSAETTATAEAGASAEVVTAEPAKTDATWQTYVNKATGIEFKWPSKGRYAPQWTFSSEAESSAKIKDGCYVADGAGDAAKVKAGDYEYCRTTAKTDAALLTWYATKVGPNYAIIAFSKSTASASVSGFDWDEYLKHLDSIAATLVKK